MASPEVQYLRDPAFRRTSLVRKRSFPNTATVGGHDFRKGFRGSVLEMKSREATSKVSLASKFASVLRSLNPWSSSKKKEATAMSKASEVEKTGPSYFDLLPNEVVVQIVRGLEWRNLLDCRTVDKRWNDIITRLIHRENPVVLSRLIISSAPRRGLSLSWVIYGSKQISGTIIVPYAEIKRKTLLEFNFGRLIVKRLVLKEVALTAELVEFVRRHILLTDNSQLNQFTLEKCDFTQSDSMTLHLLLQPICTTVYTFEVLNCFGMTSDSVSEDHLSHLNIAKIRRLAVDNIQFSKHLTRRRKYKMELNIGDAFLKRLLEAGNYPMIALDRCRVTTKTVCDYTQGWFCLIGEDDSFFTRSQICTVKRCSNVDGKTLEEECRRRGVTCIKRRNSNDLEMYAIQMDKKEFTVALGGAAREGEEACADLKSSNISLKLLPNDVRVKINEKPEIVDNV